MVHPLLKLVATRPDLLTDHAQAYAELLGDEVGRSMTHLRDRALYTTLAGGLALLALTDALALVLALALRARAGAHVLALLTVAARRLFLLARAGVLVLLTAVAAALVALLLLSHGGVLRMKCFVVSSEVRIAPAASLRGVRASASEKHAP